MSLLAGDIYGDTPIWRSIRDAQGALLPGLDRQPRAARCGPGSGAGVNIRDVEAPGIVRRPARSCGGLSARRSRWLGAGVAPRGACADELPLPGPVVEGRWVKGCRRTCRQAASRSGSSASASPGSTSTTTAAPTRRQHVPAARCRSSPTAARILRADRDGARADPVRRSPDRRRRQSRRVGADQEQGRRGAPRHAGPGRHLRDRPQLHRRALAVEQPQAEARAAPAGARGDHARAARRARSALTFSPNLNLDISGLRRQAGTSACSPGRCSRTGATTSTSTASRRSSRPRTRPAYEAPGGYAGWRAVAAFSRRYGNAWLGAFVRYDNLHGAVFAPEPARAQGSHSHRGLRHLMDLRDFEPARTDRRLSGEAGAVAGAASPSAVRAASSSSWALMSLAWALLAPLLSLAAAARTRPAGSAAPRCRWIYRSCWASAERLG